MPHLDELLGIATVAAAGLFAAAALEPLANGAESRGAPVASAPAAPQAPPLTSQRKKA